MPPIEGTSNPSERRRQWTAAVVVAILAVLAMVLVAQQMLAAPSSGEASTKSGQERTNSAGMKTPVTLENPSALRETRVDPHNTDHPAVKYLNPALLKAVQRAKAAAKADGIEDFWLTSGWRTAGYQQELLDSAIRKHGSEEAARKWVRTPENSEHVHGAAADIGPTAASYWMDRHASEFGLCRTYANEVWHYELKDPKASACPAMKENAAG